MKKYISLLLLFVCSALSAQTLTLQAPNVVSAGEPFRVVFTSDGKITDFDWNVPDGLTLMWGPQTGSSRSVTIINGKRESRSSETYTYLLSASAKGTYTIPAATCKVGGKQCSSSSATVEVVEDENAQAQQSGSQNAQSQASGGGAASSDPAITGTVSGEDIFMRLNLSKTTVIKGEPITAVLKLYTRQNISGFEDFKLPTFNGFWSKETYAPTNLELTSENVGGKVYQSTVIRRYVLIPQQEGTITIEPAEAVCQLRVRGGGRTGSIFDDFFDNYQTIRKRVSTGEIKVKVNPLPAGAPATFAGGVGQFNITAKFADDSIAAGEASSLIVTVSGKGNVTMLSAPKIEFPTDFDVYDVKTTDRSEAVGTSGSKVFEYPFIARSYGDFTVGPVKYSYYDNSKGMYVTAEAPETTIHVSGDGSAAAAATGGPVQGGVRQGVRDIGSDIRYIATSDPGLKRSGAFTVSSWLFYVLLAAIAALYFALCAVLGKVRAMRADVVGTRNRKAAKMATGRLGRSREYLRQGLVGAYYEELHKAVMGYVGDKLSMPQSELNKENIGEALASRGIAQNTIDNLMGIISTCEQARYAPDFTPEQMEEQYKTALETITAIESGIKKASRGAGKAAVAVALLLCCGTFASQAASDPLWDAAAEDYAAGSWDAALQKYLQIEQSGMTSDRLCYNIGNAYYKCGQLGESILYYERALKLNPACADAEYNLGIARESVLDRIDSVPEFILTKWVRSVKYLLSSNAWAFTALALMLLAAAALLLWRFASSKGVRTLAFVAACVCFIMALSAYAFSWSERGDVLSDRDAIVMQSVTSVKSSPSGEGKSLFILHEGTKVEVLDSVGDWVKVEIADGRQGWMPEGDISRI